MKPLVYTTGQRIGKLTVIGRGPNNKQNCATWRCSCDCGGEILARAASLKAGKTVSCGCEKVINRFTSVDISGQRFGRLVAIERSEEKDTNGQYYWKCKCDCGNEKLVRVGCLKSGDTLSCGCFRKGNNSHNHLEALKRPPTEGKNRSAGRCKKWKQAVIARDGGKCQKCGSSKMPFAHHINGWDKFKSMRFDVNNGITFCLDCHKEFHAEYGYGNNEEKQVMKFMETNLKLLAFKAS